MTDLWIGLPDKSASGSTPKESSAAKTETAPKLDVQRELDRKPGEPSIASDAPRPTRKLRIAGTIAVLLAVLTLGWGVGLKTHDFANVTQLSTLFRDTAVSLMSHFDVVRKQMVASIEGLANTSPSQETWPDRTSKNMSEVIENVARGLSIKVDQVRASSESAIRELRTGIERLNGSVERSQRDQREILAKIDQLQQRLELVEQHSVGASSTPQPAAVKPASVPGQAAQKPTTALTQMKQIENWEVMEVVDGTAVLAGPRGLIEVSSGDVVPGVGRVASIFRRGGRWVVATNKGVITGR